MDALNEFLLQEIKREVAEQLESDGGNSPANIKLLEKIVDLIEQQQYLIDQLSQQKSDGDRQPRG